MTAANRGESFEPTFHFDDEAAPLADSAGSNVVDVRKVARAETALASAGSAWTRLPAPVLALCASWLDDARSMIELLRTCKAWHAGADKLPWRAFYHAQFEPESAADKLIAANGEDTPWMARFKARSQVESRWRTPNNGELVCATTA